MIEPNIFIAFGIGFLSFISPCILPVLPGYFSFLAGVAQDEKKRKLKVFITSLFFVSGFLLILVILGASASAAGYFLLKNKNLWQKIGGLLIVIFGLQTMGFLKLSFLQKGKNWQLEKLSPYKQGKSFLAGAGFGIGWSPCIGPALGSILILSSQAQTLGRGIGLLISFASGLAIPMLLSGFFWGQLKLLKSPNISLISGGILIILGMLLIFNQYSKLTIWTADIYQFLGIPIY